MTDKKKDPFEDREVDSLDEFFEMVKTGSQENFLSLGEVRPMLFAFRKGNPIVIMPVPMDNESDKNLISAVIGKLRKMSDAVAFISEVWMKSFEDGEKADLNKQVSTYEDKQEALMATFYIEDKTVMNFNRVDRSGEYTKCLGWKSMDDEATLRGRFT